MALDTEVDTQEVVGSEEEQSASEAAGFASVFGGAPVDTTAAETKDQDDEGAETQDSAAAGVDDTPAADDENGDAPSQEEADRLELKGLLDSLPAINEKQALTESQIRHINGKLGEINRLVQSLKTSSSAAPEPIKLSKESFKRLNEDYPELAQKLADDLSELPLGGRGGNTPVLDLDQEVNSRVSVITEQLAQETEKKLLTIAHRDWRQVVAGEEFKRWLATKPEAEQNRFYSEWDAVYLSGVIDEFKDHRTQQAQQRASKEAAVAERNERLSRALPPKTTKAPPVLGLTTESEGFAAVFSKR